MTSTMAEKMTSTDRIEKKVLLRAPLSRVWQALADSQQFGQWFGVRLEEPFTPGKKVIGKITNPGYENIPIEMDIERIEPQRYFSYRWHPYGIDKSIDYSHEPTTLVEFMLDEAKDGTELTVVESGFDRIPASRRDVAFRMNDAGWTGQTKRIAAYVEK